MSRDDQDREIARIFAEQRRSDEASAPALPELMARPRPRRTSWSVARIMVMGTAAAAVIAAIRLLRPARPRDGGPDAALPPATA